MKYYMGKLGDVSGYILSGVHLTLPPELNPV
jgi:hypothetical protein